VKVHPLSLPQIFRCSAPNVICCSFYKDDGALHLKYSGAPRVTTEHTDLHRSIHGRSGAKIIIAICKIGEKPEIILGGFKVSPGEGQTTELHKFPLRNLWNKLGA
jgi:hypothetical protein